MATYTPEQMRQVREGLRKASYPYWDTADDEGAVQAFLATAVPSPFTRELQGVAPGATGSSMDQSQKALAGLDQWSANFKAVNGRWATKEELRAAWGDFGVAVSDYIDASGKRPSLMTPEEKAAFFEPLQGLALTTPPGGSMGAAYVQVPTAAEREQTWRRDFDAKNAAAKKAYDDAQIAIQQGNLKLAQEQLALSQKMQEEANAIQQANVTGFYGDKPTLEREQLAIQAAKYGRPLEQMALQRGQPIQNYAGMPDLRGNVAPGGSVSQGPGTGGAPGPTAPRGIGKFEQDQWNTQGPAPVGPEMPYALRTILEGRPLASASSGGNVAPGFRSPFGGSPLQLRAAGAQAQANESPLEKNARYEAYSLAGKNPETLDWEEERVRKNLGQGLAPGRYAPTGAYR